MMIRIDTDVLTVKSDELRQLASRMARYTDELYEIEAAVSRIASLQECAIPIKKQIANLTDETKTLLGSSEALREIAELYKQSEQSSMDDIYGGTDTNAGYMRTGQVVSIDPAKAGSYW